MHLKSLEIQGFKSFPDKTTIQFGSDITAIVGPNGSGKSNISDSILWVMGEQSTKTLRGAKMEDVIFGGTQKRAPVGFAEATLTLDNTDRALPYDADEVMVTRRYYRSGDSEFYINKQSARLRDIHELFMDTGLGREGYSNVSQGRIDEILAVKSTDRREIFEEAAGISKYRHRKEETERKLLTTEDNLLRIGDKVSELELQLEPLKAQSEKARNYLAYKEELRGLEIAVWLENLDKIAAAAKKAEEDYASSSFVLEQEHMALDGLYRKAEELSGALREQDTALEAVREQVTALEATGRQLDGQVALFQGSIRNNEQNVARIREELSQQEGRSSGIAQQIAGSRKRIAAIDEELQLLRRTLEETGGEIQRLAANAEGITKQYLELRSRQSALQADIAGRQADLAALEESVRQAQSRMEDIQADLDAGRRRQDQAQQAMDACQKALQSGRDRVRTLTNAMDGYQLRQSGRLQRRDGLREQLRRETSQLDSVSAKARVYRAMEQDFESYNKSVRSIMQESRRGGLEHIHGPVSHLIHTEDRFTTAIEIALGAAMQQIVVDTESDAKAAIGFLKRTGGGRATFLPLSAISPRSLQESGVDSCRGFVGVASRLVRCEDRYRGIVENLLGRTVIVEELDSAIAMARQYRSRFKIVTLDGQVMNPGGSMTGGSVQRTGGLLTRGAEEADLAGRLAKAQQALAQGEEQLRAARQQVRQASEALEAKQAAGPPQDTTLIQQAQAQEETLRARREELAALQGTLGAFAPLLDQLQRQRDNAQADRARQAAQLQRWTAENQSLTEEIATLEQEIAALEQTGQTLAAQGEAGLQAKRALDQARAENDRAARQANDTQLRLQRECGALEQKKLQANLEEKRLLDRLWDTYGLTHQAALALRQPVEDPAQAQRKTAQLNRAIQALGTVNLGALEEYQRVEERYRYLTDQKTDVETARQELEGVIDGITREMETIFRREFAKVQAAFAQTFADLFGGGRGTLALEDENDVLRCGIDIQVQPPGKTLRSISLLSGGERSLVAIALYFAILKVHPTPFCVMDEIEAALDEANGARFIRYLGKVAGQTQFLLITHRRETMEAADVLYGVTMERQGVSRVLKLDLRQAEELLGSRPA